MVQILTFIDDDGHVKGVTESTPFPVTDLATADGNATLDAILEVSRQMLSAVQQLELLNAQFKEAFGTCVELEDL